MLKIEYRLLRDAAEFLEISLQTARRWIKSGKLQAQLREGPHGPEYVIGESELIRVKNAISPQNDSDNVDMSNEEIAGYFDVALHGVQTMFTKRFEDLERILANVIEQNQSLHTNLKVAQKTIEFQNSMIENNTAQIVQLQQKLQEILEGEIWIANEIKNFLQAGQEDRRPKFFRR